MKFKDDEAAALWAKGVEHNQDPYGHPIGHACYAYASEWATRMEAEFAKGQTIAQVAKRTSAETADDEGITGFIYGMAVQILAAMWIHGEALRLWHNLDCQIGNEGEKANEKGTVLNPAILTINT